MDKETIMHVKLCSEEGETPLSVTCIGKRYWEPGESIGFQISNIYAVLYVKSGKGIVTQGSLEEIPLDSGSLFTLFPRIRFRFAADAVSRGSMQEYAGKHWNFFGTFCSSEYL